VGTKKKNTKTKKAEKKEGLQTKNKNFERTPTEHEEKNPSLYKQRVGGNIVKESRIKLQKNMKKGTITRRKEKGGMEEKKGKRKKKRTKGNGKEKKKKGKKVMGKKGRGKKKTKKRRARRGEKKVSGKKKQRGVHDEQKTQEPNKKIDKKDGG